MSHNTQNDDKFSGLKFHIESQDYFGTLATILKINLDSQQFTNPRVVEELVYLQEHYDILPRAVVSKLIRNEPENENPSEELRKKLFKAVLGIMLDLEFVDLPNREVIAITEGAVEAFVRRNK